MGAAASPVELDASPGEWLPCEVPGTVGAALLRQGRAELDGDPRLDDHDWWFRVDWPAGFAGPGLLHLDGLATIADVWWNGEPVLHAEQMFLAHEVHVEVAEQNRLDIAFRSLTAHLAGRRPRPRWKTRLVDQQALRWVRTTFLGRTPTLGPRFAPVGPYRPVRLVPAAGPRLREMSLGATVDDGTGVLDVRARVSGIDDVAATTAVVLVDGRSYPVDVDVDVDAEGAGGASVSARVRLEGVELWSPWTHGRPVLHDVELVVATPAGEQRFALGRVGFRTIEVVTDDGAFALRCNGAPVFCRGACWVPLDVVSLQSGPGALRAALEQVRGAGMNMIRVTGTTVYEDDELHRCCDELGILVWQDLMFANFDYPVLDEGFRSAVEAELRQVLPRLAGHASTAVVCGGSEVEQQAAMMGLGRDQVPNELGRQVAAELVAALVPGAAYVPCSPSGGHFPFSPSTGVSHYYGVGAYLRPLEDARRSRVQFTSECLAFSAVPERPSVEQFLADGERPGHSPRWKARVPRDRGAGWDFEDVRDHYVRTLLGVDPLAVRYGDPDRYLDLGRAAVCAAVEATLSEWRRPGSGCAGALVYQLRDLWEGAGWGLVDVHGQPKSSWYAMARTCAPLAVVLTDEGLDGLHAHVVNDRPEPFDGVLEVGVHGVESQLIDERVVPCRVEAGSGRTISVDEVVGSFRDLTYGYRFGPRAVDVVVVRLRSSEGELMSRAVHLSGGLDRAVERSVGLGVVAVASAGSTTVVEVRAEALAQFVCIDGAGWVPSHNWFHLEPGASQLVELTALPGRRASSVEVRALNSRTTASVRIVPSDGGAG